MSERSLADPTTKGHPFGLLLEYVYQSDFDTSVLDFVWDLFLGLNPPCGNNPFTSNLLVQILLL